MPVFNIASVVMKIIEDTPYQFVGLSKFATNESISDNIRIYMKCCDCIPKPKGRIVLDEGIKWILNSNMNNVVSFYVCDEETEIIVFKVDINESWNEAVIYYLKDRADGEYAIAGPVGEILFRNLLLFQQGISIHASALKFEGKGIIFSAPSGTGKTTHAELWKALKNAEIINGDRPALKICNNIPQVFGTPWSGSSGVFSNSFAPLKAIVLLEQYSRNEFYKLNNKEAVSLLLPRCFLPYFSNDLISLAINNLDNIIASTPVYLLKCKPDREAVEMVYKCIS